MKKFYILLALLLIVTFSFNLVHEISHYDLTAYREFETHSHHEEGCYLCVQKALTGRFLPLLTLISLALLLYTLPGPEFTDLPGPAYRRTLVDLGVRLNS